jgi:hypothetical protein
VAKACTEEKSFIAALKRCATQNQCLSAPVKPTSSLLAPTARLKSRALSKQNQEQSLFPKQNQSFFRKL